MRDVPSSRRDPSPPDAARPDRASALSRRGLLRLGALAGVAGIVGAETLLAEPAGAGSVGARSTSAVTWDAAPTSAPTTAAPTTAAPTAGPRPATPRWVRTWHDPISTLDDFTRRCPDEHFAHRSIMLTIDDGPDPEWTPKYLRLLAKHDVTATFSLIGMEVKAHPQIVRATASEGHHLANHTWHHPLNLPYLSSEQIRREIDDTTDVIVRTSGVRPRQFRAPGGVWGPDVFERVSASQMMPLGWDIDPRDWSLPGVEAIRRAMLAARPHDIILCHDGGGDRSETYQALTTVIPALLARGYTFVTLPEPRWV